MNAAVRLFIFLSFLICSCNTKARKKKQFSQYYIICKLKKNNIIESDTTGALEYTDSSAYLRGSIKFGRFLTDWTIAKFQLPRPEPISFSVLNEKKQDILKNLSPSTIMAIDSIAKIKIAIEKNAVYDSTGQIRIYDTTQKGLRKYLDSIIDKRKAKKLKAK